MSSNAKEILERVTTKTAPLEPPGYSPFGYIITEDGTTYALHRQWTHGFVLACLHPEALAEYTPETPERGTSDSGEEEDQHKLRVPNDVDHVNVYAFQRFEFWYRNQPECRDIRVCTERMLDGCASVDLPEEPCSETQIKALRLALINGLGLDSDSEISTDHGVTDFKGTIDMAALDKEARLRYLYASDFPETQNTTEEEW